MRRSFSSNQLAWGLLLIMLMSLGSARALLSITTALLAVLALWHQWRENWPGFQRSRDRELAIAMSSLFGLALLSGFNTSTFSAWMTDLYARLPLLLIPLSLAFLPAFSVRQRSWLSLGYISTQTVIALSSLVRFALTYDEVMYRVERNASVDVITGASHIYFGLTLAFSSCLALYLFLQRSEPLFKGQHWLYLALGAIDFVALHFFTSRTGLMALYAGLAVGGVMYLIQRKAWLMGVVLVAVLTLTPYLAYQLVPSFRVRVDVTRWDYQQFNRPDADITYNSASLRLMAWQTAGELIESHPFTGVGLRDVKPEMEAQYTRNGAFERAKIPLNDPHNQYLMYLVGAGGGAFLLLLFVLVYPLFRVKGATRILMGAFLGAIAMSMLFESIIERQVGMTFFAVFYLLIPQLGTDEPAHPLPA